MQETKEESSNFRAHDGGCGGADLACGDLEVGKDGRSCGCGFGDCWTLTMTVVAGSEASTN